MPSAAFADAYTAKFARGMCSCTEGDVHDRAATVILHVPRCVLAKQGSSRARRPRRQVEVGDGQLEKKRLRGREARIVDEHVEPTQRVDDVATNFSETAGSVRSPVDPVDAVLPMILAELGERARVLVCRLPAVA